MSYKYNLLTFRAHSGIHNGSGQEYGVVDLPIQRERVTNYPVILGPSIKGSLRQWMQEVKADPQLIDAIFGPEKNSEYAGALCVGDARLLLFPMRSLKGTFALATCHLALHRLKQDVEHCNLAQDMGNTPDLPEVKDNALICSQSKLSIIHGQEETVVLEEYGFPVQKDKKNEADAIAKWLLPLLNKKYVDDNDIAYRQLAQRLVILPDDYFQNFATFATEVITRTHLDDNTKTVIPGHLWTEELLPAESVLVSTLACCAERKKNGQAAGKTGEELLAKLAEKLPSRIQIGGHETVGQGICQIHWLKKYPEEPEIIKLGKALSIDEVFDNV